MSEERLVAELKRRYETADKKEVVTAIHLFGIAFAKDLVGHSINRIAEAATGHGSYGSEIRKGMRLAPHVSLRE